MEFGKLISDDQNIPVPPGHQKMIVTQLVDKTDVHENLMFEQEWLLAPNEAKIEVAAPVVAIEDVLSGEGIVYLKHAALPEARQIKPEVKGQNAEVIQNDFVIEKK